MTTSCSKCGAPMPQLTGANAVQMSLSEVSDATLVSGANDLFVTYDKQERRKPRLSAKQKSVVGYLGRFRYITTWEAIELIGGDIYANANKHVGALLANMVKRGLLVREKRGVFVLPKEVKP